MDLQKEFEVMVFESVLLEGEQNAEDLYCKEVSQLLSRKEAELIFERKVREGLPTAIFKNGQEIRFSNNI